MEPEVVVYLETRGVVMMRKSPYNHGKDQCQTQVCHTEPRNQEYGGRQKIKEDPPVMEGRNEQAKRFWYNAPRN